MVYGYSGMEDMGYTSNKERHGGPFDRGSADSYYQRQFSPHYFVKDTANSNRIELSASNPEHHELISEYTRGFNHNEAEGSFKEW
jgi:hypothetical protein